LLDWLSLLFHGQESHADDRVGVAEVRVQVLVQVLVALVLVALVAAHGVVVQAGES